MRMNIQSSEIGQTMAPVQHTPSSQQAKQMTTTEKVHIAEKSMTTDTKINHTELNALKTKDNESKDNKLKDNESKDNLKEKQLLAEIERSSGKIEVENKGLQFSIHQGTNRIMVRVINEKTKEVVREIPPEKVLDAIAKIIDLSGIFIDEKR